MVYSIRFSEDEEEMIRQYALLQGMNISEVIRKATKQMIEDEMDVKAFIEAKKRFESNPVTYSHEDVGKELGFR